MMMLAVAFVLLGIVSLWVDGKPTVGDGYGDSYGYGSNYGGAEGGAGGYDKHGGQAHLHGGSSSSDFGKSYGDDRRLNNLYRGEHDSRRDRSDRNRAHVNNHRNHQAGDGYENRGKFDDGFQNVYHKEEFSKNKKFFDTDRDNKLQQNYNDYGNYFGDADSRYYGDAVDSEANVKVGGQRGNNYGKKYYDDEEADYATKNYGKEHEGYGKQFDTEGYEGGGGGGGYNNQYY